MTTTTTNKTSRGAVVAAVLLAITVVLVSSAVSIFGTDAASAARPKPPVTKPIAEQHAYVDPLVGQQMNGKKDKVKLASKVHMHKPGAGLSTQVEKARATAASRSTASRDSAYH